MAEFKDRSFIFKVLYVLLSIITFPIFLILFILRHPLWILMVVLVAGGVAIYYPLNEGIKFDDIPVWYQKKYAELKHKTVLKAREKGITELVPQAMLSEVKKMEEEAEEAKLPKSENYNSKVVRSAESEETKNELKKRSGFKKREVVQEEKATQEKSEENLTQKNEDAFKDKADGNFINENADAVAENESVQEKDGETNPIKNEAVEIKKDITDDKPDEAELELSF